MSPNLVKSALFSTGVHLSVLIPFFHPGIAAAPPRIDLAAGISSVELEWVEPSAMVAAPKKKIPVEPEADEAVKALGRPAAPPEQWLQDAGVLHSFSGPGAIANPVPLYPLDARLRGWEGTVVIQISVNPMGGVAASSVNRSSGHDSLDGAALAAVQRWRFRPARRKGRAVASQVEIPITFRLEQQTEQ